MEVLEGGKPKKIQFDWKPVAPAVSPLPLPWREMKNVMECPPGAQRTFADRHLFVVLDNTIKPDGSFWLHVSISRQDRVPNYSELCEVKRLFIGEERTAIHVWPRSSEHVNIHARCLHLWSPEPTNLVIPDFTFGLGTI